ncbi:hypothetical protein Tco_0085246 [Tanacetum coccineum]
MLRNLNSMRHLSGNPLDKPDYRSKIGSLMYLTSSRPDIVQAVCYCARYQARPTEKHLKEVKRIFRYLRGTINMTLVSEGLDFELKQPFQMPIWIRLRNTPEKALLEEYSSYHVDEDTASRLWLQLQQNTVVLRLSVSHSNLMQPRAALPYQAHPYSVSFHQGIGSVSCQRIGNESLTPEELEVSAKRIYLITHQTSFISQAVNKSPTHYPCDSARTFRVILFSIHNDEWKSFQCHHQTALRRPYALSWKPCQGDSLNLPDHRIHKDGDGDASFQLESDSLPHAHAQTTKTYYKHQDSRIMKAQELKTKTSAQTLIYKIFLQRYQVYQGRLLASFQDDAKYEHVGQDTRSQGGKDDQDGRIKI